MSRSLSSLSTIVVATVLAVGGIAAGCLSGPQDVGDESVGETAQALTTCVTIQRGTLGTVEDATIANGVTIPGWSPATLYVGSQKESLVKFDVSSLPSGAVVSSATLSLYTTSTVSGAPLWARFATAPWTESTVTFASFNQQVNNKVSGSMTPTAPNTAQTLTVKSATVQGWLDGSIPNYGLVLETMITQPAQWKETAFVSSESPTVALRPSLQVCYSTVDYCAPAPCLNGGTCTSGLSGYTCACAPGFTGNNCQTNIDDCAGNPCQNGGACADGVNGYTCSCAPGYAGPNCQTDINECAGNPCQNGGVCSDHVNAYSCACPAGFTGNNCQTNIDDCAGSPCQNGGSCTDGVNGYTCVCPAGFTGANCQTNVDDCAGNACQNGSTCVDGIAGYTCSCAPGFAGVQCEINIDDCAGSPCQNGGTCNDGVNGYTCSCAAGYTGTNCEIDINDCASNPCQNSGICVDGVNSYSCLCAAGYSGVDCEVDVDDCASDPCVNGDCTDGVNSYTCSCLPGFTGANCEIDVDDCAGNPCQNGGTCVDGVNAYTCQCAAGFVGASCQTNVDDCAGAPCLNGGICVDGVNLYTCACPIGFMGVNCELNVDDCAGGPCQNGGSCTDGVNAYSCSCLAGFIGPNCEINVDDCASMPCQNGGSCTDGVNQYTCACQAGYAGNNCQINIDDCAGNPCQNGGSCVDGVNSYSCVCAAGFTGANCQTNIDDCAAGPCQHGGSCVDGINSYSCVCPAGYAGQNCQINIDDCAAAPCQHGGACVDGVNSYTCVCAAGYTGSNCQINIDDCAGNPCQHGGACTDGVNSYTCACTPGYTGASCQINIDDCASMPCQNGGTCTDGVNGYTCACPSGYSGTNCEIIDNPGLPEITSSATYAPSDGLAYATITVTPRNANGKAIGAGLHVEVMSTDPLVTLGGNGTSPCTVNGASATCLTAVDSGAGSYVITAKRSSIQAIPTVFSATYTQAGITTIVSDTADVTFDSTKFQGGANCAGACGTTIASGTVTVTNGNAGSRNLYITGGTVTFDATTVGQTFGDVFITGGTVTHLKGSNAAMFKLDVNAGSWNFLGGTIDLVEKGYGMTCQSNGSCSGNGLVSFVASGAPSSALAGTNEVYGASHGGMGSGNYRQNISGAANTQAGNSGPTYDDYRDPRFPGATNSTTSGFHGGGVKRVTVTKPCVLAGTATVNATSPFNGAGGTINLRCAGITSMGWTGTLNADGGPASGNSSIPLGAGGGGRVALVSTGDAATITGALSYPPANITARVHAYGGAPANAAHVIGAGGAGTIYVKHSDLVYGDLIVANNSPAHYMNEGTTRLPSIAGTINGNVAAGALAIPVTIQSTSFNGTYYDNTGAPTITNPPLTQNVTASTAAAYNGVFNGVWLRPSITANGGALLDPTNLVSVTTNTAGSLSTSAVPSAVASGTVFRSIDIVDHLDVTGNAMLETNGDVYVLSGNVANSNAATMTLSGYALFDTTNGNLGKIQYAGGVVNVVESTQAMPPVGGGTLRADNVTISGSGGVQVPAIITSNSVTLTAGSLITNAITAVDYTQAAGTLRHYPPLFKTSPASAIVYSLAMTLSGNFNLNGGSVDAAGLGYPLAADPQGTPLTAWGFGATGPLAATGVSMGFGASHGGTGGGYTAGAVRGLAYDDYRDPRFPGGAAATTGGSPTYLSWRSHGGGVIRVLAAGTCKLASSTTITASAVVNASQNFGAAGGAVSMSCGAFNTTGWTGTINVNGAAAYTQASLGSTRAGGGGRIALVSTGGAASFVGAIAYPLPTNSALLQARGGAGLSATYTDGGAGTVFLKHSGVAYGQLLINNNSQTHYAGGGTTPLISIAGTINGNVAAGSTTIGATITSSPLYSTGSFNGLIRGMWLRPDTAVNNGSLLTDNLVFVSNDTFVNSALTNLTSTPTLAALASGAAFKSIDILDKYDVVGGAFVSTNGDVYTLP